MPAAGFLVASPSGALYVVVEGAVALLPFRDDGFQATHGLALLLRRDAEARERLRALERLVLREVYDVDGRLVAAHRLREGDFSRGVRASQEDSPSREVRGCHARPRQASLGKDT